MSRVENWECQVVQLSFYYSNFLSVKRKVTTKVISDWITPCWCSSPPVVCLGYTCAVEYKKGCDPLINQTKNAYHSGIAFLGKASARILVIEVTGSSLEITGWSRWWTHRTRILLNASSRETFPRLFSKSICHLGTDKSVLQQLIEFWQ